MTVCLFICISTFSVCFCLSDCLSLCPSVPLAVLCPSLSLSLCLSLLPPFLPLPLPPPLHALLVIHSWNVLFVSGGSRTVCVHYKLPSPKPRRAVNNCRPDCVPSGQHALQILLSISREHTRGGLDTDNLCDKSCRPRLEESSQECQGPGERGSQPERVSCQCLVSSAVQLSVGRCLLFVYYFFRFKLREFLACISTCLLCIGGGSFRS